MMKKMYNAPKSERVLFDPLMTVFGTDSASPSPTGAIGQGQQGQQFKD